MSDGTYEASFLKHNLAATFRERAAAERAAELLSNDVDGTKVEVSTKREEPQVKYAEMRDELEGVVASPVLGSAMTKSQTQGAVGGALVAGAIGLLIGAAIGFMVHGAPGANIWWVRWVLVWAFIPAVAAGTLGMLAGGLLKSRHAPAPEDTAPPREATDSAGIEPAQTSVVQFATNDEQEFQKAFNTLQQLQPDRLDRFDEQGKVVATQDLGEKASS